MKKLLVLIICSITFAACGADTSDCTCTPEETDFFKEYLADCVDWCTTAAQLADECAATPFSVEECTSNAWWAGCSNRVCKLMNGKTIEQLENNDCTDTLGMPGVPKFGTICRDL